MATTPPSFPTSSTRMQVGHVAGRFTCATRHAYSRCSGSPGYCSTACMQGALRIPRMVRSDLVWHLIWYTLCLHLQPCRVRRPAVLPMVQSLHGCLSAVSSRKKTVSVRTGHLSRPVAPASQQAWRRRRRNRPRHPPASQQLPHRPLMLPLPLLLPAPLPSSFKEAPHAYGQLPLQLQTCEVACTPLSSLGMFRAALYHPLTGVAQVQWRDAAVSIISLHLHNVAVLQACRICRPWQHSNAWHTQQSGSSMSWFQHV